MGEATVDPFASITDVAPQIASRVLSPVALTECILDRIKTLDPAISSYAHVAAPAARAQARAAEREIADGRYRGPLHGVPVALKDLFDTAGMPTEIGSAVYAGHVPARDAFVVERLRAAGAIILGKTAMTEFAAAGYHPSEEPPKNPWNVDHGPGVSSGGSGAALAAGLCFGALGTDTGGSIRMPAAACGITGLKPTFGRVSRSGVFPLSHTLDHVGPMARTAADAGILLDAIAGYDAADPASVAVPDTLAWPSDSNDLDGVVIGVDRVFCTDDVAPEVAHDVLATAEVFSRCGATIRAVGVRWLADIGPAWKKVVSTDALVAHAGTWPDKAPLYGPVFTEMLRYGEAISGVEIADAHQQRGRLKRRIAELFLDIDVLLCPSEPFTAPSWDQFPPQFITPLDALAWVLRFAAPFNFSGNPTLALPCGFSPSGLPTGMQLVGRHFEESLLLRAGAAYQQRTDWHCRHPRLG